MLAASPALADGVHHLDMSMGHGCVANDCDSVWCWGGEEFVFGGADGVDYKGPPEHPYQVGAGDRHSCVNMRDIPTRGFAARGVIDCWGRNDDGQIDVPPEHDWRQLSVGANHNCATNWANEVICWGNDDYGQVSNVPAGERFALVSSHETQSCGVGRLPGNDDGQWVSCWGKTAGGVTRVNDEELENIFPDERFTQVAAGGAHTCALSNRGRVYCWGSNSASQLSPDFNGTPTGIVTLLENGTEMHMMPGGLTYEYVAAGEVASCAVFTNNVTSERGVQCWGYPFSQGVSLWTHVTKGELESHLLPFEGDFDPVAVDVTFNEVCARSRDGELQCFALSYTRSFWTCDPMNDPHCCDDLDAACCDPQQEPACCDPAADPFCTDLRSWTLIPDVDLYACA